MLARCWHSEDCPSRELVGSSPFSPHPPPCKLPTGEPRCSNKEPRRGPAAGSAVSRTHPSLPLPVDNLWINSPKAFST